jgi:peroxiredoxin
LISNEAISSVRPAARQRVCGARDAALNEGDKAPFSAQASLAGKAFNYSLRDALKKGPVVVYFYPSAFTGGCNLQAHTFAENIDKFSPPAQR